MQKFDLETMSTEVLWSLHEKVTRILSARITSEKRELEKRLAALGHGILDQAAKSRTGEVKPRRKYPRVLPKYRNPLVATETWSGRGKQPRWLVAAIKSGHKIDEFRIKDTAEPKQGRSRG